MKEMTEQSILDAVELFERDRTASPDLAAALWHFAEQSNPTDPLVESVVRAFGKRYDNKLKPYFIAILGRIYRVNPQVGYQCMIALDNLDENLPGGGSAVETDRNTRLAEEYLKRIGAQQ